MFSLYAKNKFYNLNNLAILLLTLAAFFLTLWRFGANQCLMILLVLAIFYAPWRRKFLFWRFIKTPVILTSVLFIAWVLISITYTQSPNFHAVLRGLSIYDKLLFLLVLPVMIQGNKEEQRWLENGLIYGVLVNVVLSTLYYYHLPVLNGFLRPYMSMDATFSVNPLQLIYVVNMALWLLTMRLVNREFNLKNIAIFIILSIYLWFINVERSGYVLFLSLVLVYLFQQFGKRAFIFGLLIIPFISFLFYQVSDNMRQRVGVGVENIVAYQKMMDHPELISANNSLGLRLAFISESFVTIKEYPFFGAGIGSYKYIHTVRYPEQQASFPVTEPHNAYIYVLFELGLVGLFLYFSWLYALFRLTLRLDAQDRRLLQGIWVMFVVMGFLDGGLVLNALAVSFIVWCSFYFKRAKEC